MLQVWSAEKFSNQQRWDSSRACRDRVLEDRIGQLLDEPDRTLLRLDAHGITRRALGSYFGKSAGSISRRVSTLRRRIQTPLVRSLIDPRCPLSELDQRIAARSLVSRTPIKRLAHQEQLSIWQLQQRLLHAQGALRALAAARRSTRLAR
jgi:hypothetical protein